MFDKKGSDSSIFREKSVLSSNYTPDSPIGRDEEIDKIVDGLQPLVTGSTPEHLLIYGPAGTGKSTCVEYVFDHLGDETRVKPVWINCWKYNSRASLLTELLIQLGYPAPRKGKPVDELLSKLGEWLDKNRGFAVALDEFDRLDERTDVIYDLHMLNQEVENTVGIVMISNQPPEEIDLDPRSQSRLNCQPLEFQNYSKSQLVEILESRVRQAFEPGAVNHEVIVQVAEDVARQNGDCRKALEMLLRAGRRAEREGTSEVSTDDL